MARARLSIGSSLLPLVSLLAAVAPSGCYKPKILEGGLKCNLAAGAKACPEGFKCDPQTQTCFSNLDAGAADRRDGGDGSDVSDGGDGGPDGPCFDARPACTPTPGNGMCDPYCRTGCGCQEKCSVNTAGALTCKPPAQGQQRTLLQPCQVQMAGTLSQIDQCAPGLLCREDSCGGGGGTGRCYQFCRSDMDCTNTTAGTTAPCNVDVGGGFKVCDVPYDDCSPLPSPNNSGCMGSAIGCYLSTSDPSKTICDCEFPPGAGEGDVCTRSRECHPGLVCVDPNGQGTKQCTRVCRLAVPTDCTVGTCRTYSEGTTSNTTYGFCR